ncbi:MAG: hypothetical protein LBG05_10620 [Treponema sp.]|jgi:hypothetical protein|nr:hypothetical protein [Treponema sp.]
MKKYVCSALIFDTPPPRNYYYRRTRFLFYFHKPYGGCHRYARNSAVSGQSFAPPIRHSIISTAATATSWDRWGRFREGARLYILEKEACMKQQ